MEPRSVQGARRLAVGALACLSAIGILGLPVSRAGAATGVDATAASITCDAFAGTVSFSPPLHATPSATQKVTVSGTVAYCTTGGVAATVSTGKVKASGTFDFTSEGPNLCNSLGDFSVFASRSSSKITWKSSVPLTSGSTVSTVAPFHVSGDNNNLMLGWSFGTPTGSFQGPNHSACDVTWADGPALSTVAANCAAKAGVKKLTLTKPGFSPLLSLGSLF